MTQTPLGLPIPTLNPFCDSKVHLSEIDPRIILKKYDNVSGKISTNNSLKTVFYTLEDRFINGYNGYWGSSN